MVELVEKRTITSKVFEVSKNQKRYDFHIQPIHFEVAGQMEEINTELVDKGGTVEPLATPYNLVIKKSIAELEAPFSFSVKGKSVAFIPRGFRWDNEEVIKQEASGIVEKDADFVGLYGGFGDLLVQPFIGGVGKIVKINKLTAIPASVEFLEVGFEIVAPNAEIFYQDVKKQSEVNDIRSQVLSLDTQRLLLEKQGDFVGARALYKQQQALEEAAHTAMLSKWNETDDVRFTGEFQLIIDGVKIYGRPVRVWNDNGETRHVEIDLRLRNNKLYFTKLIPVDFLTTFPVYTDAVTSYYAGAGDGRIRNNAGAVAWSTARGAAVGTFADYTTGGDGIRTHTELHSGTSYDIWRAYLPTDTSAIDDGDTVTAASLLLYTGGDGVAKSDADTSSVYAIPTTQALTSALVVADFAAVTYTDWGNVTIASVVAGGYTTITLNATGIAGITKTGTTKIGAVDGRDFNNSAPTGMNRVSASASEQTSTTQDPYLSITTTTPVPPSKNQLLLTGLGN